jgi:signal transduction histidine kinase
MLTEAQVPFFKGVFDAWRQREAASATVTFAGADLEKVIHLLIEQTDVTLPDAEAEVRQGTYPEQVCFNFFFFARGALLAHTLEPLSEPDRNVLERFAVVFDLAYTRYEDFRQLEAKNREIEETLARLRETQEQLVQREKMASLGQLTAGIAHEIKNPLNFVNNFAGLIRELVTELEETTDPAERQALLGDLKTNAGRIEEHGRRADAIVRQMMEHARSGSGDRVVADVNALVDEYSNHAVHAARARRPGFRPSVRIDLHPDTGAVEMVPQEIGRVVINLLDNAFDATRQRASKEGTDYVPSVTVTTRRVADGVEIGVQDNGPGIPESVRTRIFEPFFTTKPTGEGTGLGLSLAYDIVTKGHRGALTFESNGTGTTFRLRLPAN